jgi:hypothetical protein
MSLTTPCSVQKLQTALHAKAKESPDFRFYAVYDKVYRRDVLAYAYERGKANGGAAGVDEQTFADIERYGVEDCDFRPPDVSLRMFNLKKPGSRIRSYQVPDNSGVGIAQERSDLLAVVGRHLKWSAESS